MRIIIFFLKIVGLISLDRKWYLSVYSDVAKSGLDPHKHFWLYGWCEGRISRKNIRIKNLLNLKLISGEMDESIPDKLLILKQFLNLIDHPKVKNIPRRSK
jgi:hypothetical protein